MIDFFIYYKINRYMFVVKHLGTQINGANIKSDFFYLLPSPHFRVWGMYV